MRIQERQIRFLPIEVFRVVGNAILLEHTTRLASRQAGAGVEHALLSMKVDGYRRVCIRRHLAYRGKGVPGFIPADAGLAVEVWLRAIVGEGKVMTTMSKRTLSACPSSPNCVSTQAIDEEHAITPFRYAKARAEAKEFLKAVMATLPRTKLVVEDDSYLHYEFTTLLLRFVDDVEFLFDETTKTIHFRSASRTGYSDLGVNRKRMEQVRALVSGKL